MNTVPAFSAVGGFSFAEDNQCTRGPGKTRSVSRIKRVARGSRVAEERRFDVESAVVSRSVCELLQALAAGC